MASIASAAARPLDIAVVGSGISGLSAAWLLAQRHRVTLFEADGRLGGHSNTVEACGGPVDTGFIVYNQTTYPNLTALFRHLGVATTPAEMTFAVSLDDGRLEYSGTGLTGLFAQPKNLASPRFWGMLRDLLRFYREAPRAAPRLGDTSLDAFLDAGGYGAAFREDHLYPMAAAIWSTPAADIGAYPAQALIRFCENHGLLRLLNRPVWRTVAGGSRAYVAKLAAAVTEIVTNSPVAALRRRPDGVELVDRQGERRRFDHAVIAAHADQALGMLSDADEDESRILGAFGYRSNRTILHTDEAMMPRRRRVWSSWNYMEGESGAGRGLAVSYWMNRLQRLPHRTPLFVTLNPHRSIRPDAVHYETDYAHPQFDAAAIAAQRRLWSLQGRRRTWFCGAYFGAGFHEDGLQAGLAVAEALGGLRRPWRVADESGRIVLGGRVDAAPSFEAA